MFVTFFLLLHILLKVSQTLQQRQDGPLPNWNWYTYWNEEWECKRKEHSSDESGNVEADVHQLVWHWHDVCCYGNIISTPCLIGQHLVKSIAHHVHNAIPESSSKKKKKKTRFCLQLSYFSRLSLPPFMSFSSLTTFTLPTPQWSFFSSLTDITSYPLLCCISSSTSWRRIT